MRLQMTHGVAALIAATAAMLAVAAEPIASLATGLQADQRMTALVDSLNGEAALEGSKLTVVPDGEVVYMAGVTRTHAQMKRALELAAEQYGPGKVANGIATEEFKLFAPAVPAAAGVEASSAAPGETIQPATPDGEKILPATPRT